MLQVLKSVQSPQNAQSGQQENPEKKEHVSPDKEVDPKDEIISEL